MDVPPNIVSPPGPTITRVPFQAWNKLEGRARSQNVDKALRAEVYDPLWFFTRQWQLGELKGEDGGSSLTAQVAYQVTRPSHIAMGRGEILKPIDTTDHHQLHPIAATQHLNFELTLQQRTHSGRYFVRLLREKDSETQQEINTIVAPYLITMPDAPTADWTHEMDRVKLHANALWKRTATLYHNRIADGLNIYQSIIAGIADGTNSGPSDTVVKSTFKQWMEQLYPHLVANQVKDGWHNENLGYDYRIAYPKLNEGNGTIEHVVMGNRCQAEPNADWYTADVLKAENETIEQPVTNILAYREDKVFPIILSRAKFGGMPARRWWEMEDGKIDLGNIEGDKSEAVKQIIAEFSSVYSNDWFSIPFKRKEQELVRIKGILVKDTFGEYTYINNALTAAGSNALVDDDSAPFEWNLFHHDVAPEAQSILNDSPDIGSSQHASFILGSSRTIASSEPVERIELIRDEMDNRVWAVESLIASQLGGAKSGQLLSDELVQYIRQLTGDADEVGESPVPLIYRLGNTIPEHYIPFVPVRSDEFPEPFSSRSIALQRAWLPRTAGTANLRVRPRTRLLRWKLDANDNTIDDLGNSILLDPNGHPINSAVVATQSRLLLKEETIPRSGLTITDRYYYGRDYNGNIHLWLGRSMKNGTEANSAQLGYDQVVFNKKVEQ